MSIAVCMPSKTSPHFKTVVAFESLQLPKGTHRFRVSGKSIEDSRRALTKAALAYKDVTHLLFIDDDMVFLPESAQRLLSHNLPIVGGLCFNRREPYQPVLARLQPPEYALEDRYGWIYDFPLDTLLAVDGTGAAFLLVAREVFEEIGLVFGAEKWWSKLEDTSEDFSFCWRARECSFEIRVDTGLEIGHVGEVVIDGAYALRNRRFHVGVWHPPYTRSREDATPHASIVIPTFNQKPELLKAAVASALMQTVPVEVIVVDDGSDEPVAEGALAPTSSPGSDPALRIFRHCANLGVAAALNTGIGAMQTDWFCWLASDDLLDPVKVERQLHLTEIAQVKASFHQYNVVYSDSTETAGISNEYRWTTIQQQMALLAKVCVINGSTAMIHKDVFQRLGLFNTNMRYGQDWDMWCRIGESYLWLPIAEILGTRRESGNLTAKIESDPELAALRDSEDASIRKRFERWT